jgi:hypothetical protein
MTTSQETLGETARRGPGVFAGFVQSWADSMQKLMSAMPMLDSRVPDAVIDNVFDVAHQVLDIQREFTKGWVAATTSAASSAASAAQNATKSAATKKS